MKKFWQEVLLLPYKSNSQDNPLHEKQVEELLIKHGLRYISQPNGIQASPDFRSIHSEPLTSRIWILGDALSVWKAPAA